MTAVKDNDGNYLKDLCLAISEDFISNYKSEEVPYSFMVEAE